MTIHEFQSRLETTTAAPDTLMSALRRLCTIESPKVLLQDGSDVLVNWVVWGSGPEEPRLAPVRID
jgi:hypothetical protein